MLGWFDVGTRAKKTEGIVKGMVLITDYGQVKAQQRREERQDRRATMKRRN